MAEAQLNPDPANRPHGQSQNLPGSQGDEREEDDLTFLGSAGRLWDYDGAPSPDGSEYCALFYSS